LVEKRGNIFLKTENSTTWSRQSGNTVLKVDKTTAIATTELLLLPKAEPTLLDNTFKDNET